MPRRILEAAELLYGQLGIRVLTPDFEILLALLDHPFLSAQELQEASPLSRAGFFLSLDKLKHWGFVSSTVSLSDRRKKRLFLTDRAREQIISNIRQLSLLVLDKNLFQLRRPLLAGGVVGDEGCSAEQASQELPHITCEYQILIHLFIRPGAAGFEIAEYVTTSASTFAVAMRRLKANGLVHDETAPGCGRRKRFFLREPAREAIEAARRLLAEYISDLDLANSTPRAAFGP